MLQQLSSMAAGIIELQPLAQLILDKATTTMEIDGAWMLLRREPLGHYHVIAAKGIDEGSEEIRWRPDHPVLRWLDQNRRVLTRTEMDCCPEFEALGPQEWADLDRMAAQLFIPLRARDDLVGVFAVGPKASRLPYSADERAALATLANQTVVAIDNARLYDQAIRDKAMAETALQETFGGIVMIDDHLRVVSMNPGAELITGYSSREVLGHRIDKVFGKQITSPGSPLIRAFDAGEKVVPAEITLVGKQEAKEVLLGVGPVTSAALPGLHYLLSFADVSKLKEVDRLKSDVVANVSHELRAPLTSIKVYTELLLESGDEADAEVRREWLSVLDQKADRLTALITEFLSLSRLESGRIELTKEPVDLGKVIADAVELLEIQAEHKHISIELDVTPGLSELLADKDLVGVVVENLVSNAIKFSHDGGNVRISVWQDSVSTTFCVEDEGIGIPRDAIPHLFTKFFRVSSDAAAGVQGIGLGLVLAKEAVVAHGGHIEVESALGEGSRFTVTFPNT